MPNTDDLRLDVATGIGQGRREHQEDAIIADFTIGGEIGLAVLGDGMGGHAAGDVASRIAVTEVFSELKLRSDDPDRFIRYAPGILREATRGANGSIAAHVRSHAATTGMGTTLVALAVARDRLFWLSVGDSPLFLFRDGQLHQINEDHSLAPQIDHMMRLGLLSADEARRHPDRNCLTSALTGAEIHQIDCPDRPIGLAVGDIIVAASDGLDSIERERLRALLVQYRRRTSAEIANALFCELETLGDPEQDNVCFSVIRVVARGGQPAVAPHHPVPAERPHKRAALSLLHLRQGGAFRALPLAARFLMTLGRRTQ
ncbi:protein phosphatase 2C domain-containing protein [Rhodovulum tesquicola]|uniref:PP2C family protein-serine/threonine phosphatase n=1 Tax=Rhodovulum tesquicola TaxID=540254 RepID=UPI00209684B3|nr:protein phosphatase 2C domain-containing protein [Rhodovulum tesquicola]MCO8146285.1 protein phosphatase 2C domain-containing protein [Rhodovulum tesquicola]